ncbi:G5 and 3D domain-containing protein [Lentibacillus saliphilus]|uniref:G5 and 3D domain-containing protein n=1 Tax=Lentibacillus saliphilus TaxID=2737028 RepID=UPI001C2F55C5|nr:G5 and 3D domain-containing protein [Lentibacillus saliphilus]
MKFISKLLPATKLKLVVSGIGIALLAVFAGVTVFELTKAEVTVHANDDEQTVRTHADTVDVLLDELSISVKEHDYLSHAQDAAIEDGMTIEYETAKKVTLIIDGEKETYYTTADDIKAFFNEHNIAYSVKDDISIDLDQQIKDGETITIDKAFKVTINVGGDKQDIWTTGGTIEGLLREQDITLNELDKVEPALDQVVTEQTPINVTRVEKTTKEVEQSVPFQTETRRDGSLAKGKQKVIANGSEGKVVKTYEVTLENGQEVARELIEENVVQESSNKIVAVGTKQPDLVTLSDTSKSGKTFTVTATAYSAYCNGCSGITATGINLKANPYKKVIAVDPNLIPLGTRVWVEGYGEAIAGDTGGAIKGHRIDVHVPTRKEALRFGYRRVQIKILD